ncbi:MAG: hypothetical protein K8T89_08940 [Planctomycetes bacterium]|nr:hypothetical protein [Planctomycetota bacterium]
MSTEVIPCPSCQHSVRVPESLFGQPVRCPQCKSYFTAPTRSEDGILGDPKLLPDPPAFSSSASDYPASAGNSSLMLPGLLLLIVGICGVATNGMIAYMLTFGMNEIVANLKKAVNNPDDQIHKFAQRKLTEEDIKEANLLVLRDVALTFLGVSTAVVLGSIAILSRRFFGLAILGSIAAIINLGNGCCLLGFPVGVYCLIKLFDPDSRALFRK